MYHSLRIYDTRYTQMLIYQTLKVCYVTRPQYIPFSSRNSPGPPIPKRPFFPAACPAALSALLSFHLPAVPPWLIAVGFQRVISTISPFLRTYSYSQNLLISGDIFWNMNLRRQSQSIYTKDSVACVEALSKRRSVVPTKSFPQGLKN